MADHAHAAPPAAASSGGAASFLVRHHFLMRRLHSLSGIVPVGVFVIAHLFTNAQMVWPDKGETFQHEVDFIHSVPALLFVEVALWLGIGFHAALGLVYTMSSNEALHNVRLYSGQRYGDNIRYFMQRVTGIIALVFIFLHIATLRWRWNIIGWFTPFYAVGHDAPEMPPELHDVPLSMPLTAYALQASWVVVLFYVVGVLAVIYHWSNGLWTAAISWGVTTTRSAQKRWGMACAGLGVALTVFFAAAIVGSLKYDVQRDTTPQQREAMSHVLKDFKAEP